MSDEALAAIAIALMALVTYATRIGGLLALDRFELGPSARRFLEAMSGSVLVCMIIPTARDADIGLGAGLAAALLIGLASSKPLFSVLGAVAVTALLRSGVV